MKLILLRIMLAILSIGIIVAIPTINHLSTKVNNLTSNLSAQSEQLAQANSENELLAATIITLADEVQLREDITSVIIDASRMYNVPPMLLTQTIRSESNFRPNIKHSLPAVECMSGINTKAHPKTLHNPTSLTGCIYASA